MHCGTVIHNQDTFLRSGVDDDLRSMSFMQAWPFSEASGIKGVDVNIIRQRQLRRFFSSVYQGRQTNALVFAQKHALKWFARSDNSMKVAAGRSRALAARTELMRVRELEGNTRKTACLVRDVLTYFPADVFARDVARTLLENTAMQDADSIKDIVAKGIRQRAVVSNPVFASCTDLAHHNGSLYAFGHTPKSLYAFSMEGHPRWELDLGLQDARGVVGLDDRTILVSTFNGKKLHVVDVDGSEIDRIDVTRWAPPALAEWKPNSMTIMGQELFMTFSQLGDTPKSRLFRLPVGSLDAFQELDLGTVGCVSTMASAGNRLLLTDFVSNAAVCFDPATGAAHTVCRKGHEQIGRLCSDGMNAYITSERGLSKYTLDGAFCLDMEEYVPNRGWGFLLGCCVVDNGKTGGTLYVLNPGSSLLHVFDLGQKALISEKEKNHAE